MIHFLPDEFDTATPCNEAVARLASIRTALIAAEQIVGIHSSETIEPGTPPTAWVEMPAAWPEARRRCFDARSIEVAQGAAAGLEMLVAQQAAGTEAHPRSVERLTLTLRTELADLDRLFSL